MRNNGLQPKLNDFKRSNLYKAFKFISSILSWTVFVLLLICAAFLLYYFISSQIYAQKGAGYEPDFTLYTIVSPSMTPNINVYDVVIVERIDKPEDIEIGDIISFNSSDFMQGETISVTHRVIEIMVDGSGNYSYYTKGDNNFVKDAEPVGFESIVGEVSFKIPQLGRIQFFLASVQGWLLVIAVPALFVIIRSVLKIIRASKISEKIPKSSKLFDAFNKPLKLPYLNRKLLTTSKEVEQSINSTDNNISYDLDISKKSTEDKSLEDIYNDLKDLSKK